MIVEECRVILETKDIEKLFQGVYITKDTVGKISDSLYHRELIFALKREFTMGEFNFTIPDILIKNDARIIHLSYKCSIIDYDNINEEIIKDYDNITVRKLINSRYYLLNYDNDTKQGIVINIDKEEISKFKLTYL